MGGGWHYLLITSAWLEREIVGTMVALFDVKEEVMWDDDELMMMMVMMSHQLLVLELGIFSGRWSLPYVV